MEMEAQVGALVEAICSLTGSQGVEVIDQILQARPELAPQVMAYACPELTYAPARSMTERRSKGVVKSLCDQSGYATISCAELEPVFPDGVRCHEGQLGMLQIGTEVDFAVTMTLDSNAQAFDVQLVGGGPTPLAMLNQIPLGACDGACMSACGGPSGCGGCGGCADAFGGCGGMVMSSISPMLSGACGGMPAAGVVVVPPGQLDGRKRSLEQASLGDTINELGFFNGMLKSFNQSKGFGFITSLGLQQQGFSGDIFVNTAHIGGCQVGMHVTFTAFINKKGQPQAKDVRVDDRALGGGACAADGLGLAPAVVYPPMF